MWYTDTVAKVNGKKNGKITSFKAKPKSRQTRFKKLRALGCFDEAHRRILQGWSPPALARWIQDGEGEYTEVSHEGLVSILKKYRDQIPPGELIRDRIPQVMQKAAQAVEEGIDELAELEKLFRQQQERIEIELSNERMMQKLFPSMTQEIRTAREILSTIAELKMDRGLHDRKLGTVDVDAHITAHIAGRYPGTKAAEVLGNPEKRQKLLGIVKQIAAQSEKEVIDVEAEAIEVQEQPSSEEPSL